MTDKELRLQKIKKLSLVVGSVATAMVGVFVVPGLLKKSTAKVYKSSQEEIDFENMGPEVVSNEDLPVIEEDAEEEKENGN